MDETQQDVQTDEKDRRKQSWGTIALVVIVFIIVLLLWRYCVPGTDVDDGMASVEIGTIPDVVGMDQADAVAAVSEAGFLASSSSVFDTSVDPGVVVFQSPGAGLEAELGSTVQIDVATDYGLGNAALEDENRAPVVPNVVGKQESDAIKAVEDAGFYASSQRVNAEPYQRDAVYDQAPEGGSTAPYGSRVVIYVSNGPSTPTNRTVPNCIGLTESAALSAVNNAGLIPQVLKRPYPSSVGKVYDQFPFGGDVVPAGSQVHVLIGTTD